MSSGGWIALTDLHFIPASHCAKRESYLLLHQGASCWRKKGWWGISRARFKSNCFSVLCHCLACAQCCYLWGVRIRLFAGRQSERSQWGCGRWWSQTTRHERKSLRAFALVWNKRAAFPHCVSVMGGFLKLPDCFHFFFCFHPMIKLGSVWKLPSQRMIQTSFGNTGRNWNRIEFPCCIYSMNKHVIDEGVSGNTLGPQSVIMPTNYQIKVLGFPPALFS